MRQSSQRILRWAESVFPQPSGLRGVVVVLVLVVLLLCSLLAPNPWTVVKAAQVLLFVAACAFVGLAAGFLFSSTQADNSQIQSLGSHLTALLGGASFSAVALEGKTMVVSIAPHLNLTPVAVGCLAISAFIPSCLMMYFYRVLWLNAALARAMKDFQKALVDDNNLGMITGGNAGGELPNNIREAARQIDSAPVSDYEAALSDGLAMIVRKEYPKALDNLTRATQINPDDYRAWLAAATAYLGTGQEPSARDCMVKVKQSIKMSALQPSVLLSCARMFTRLNVSDESKRFYKEYLSKRPTDQSTRVEYVSLLVERGKADEEDDVGELYEQLTALQKNSDILNEFIVRYKGSDAVKAFCSKRDIKNFFALYRDTDSLKEDIKAIIDCLINAAGK